MRIAINGAGIAGPTLAWWLKKYGHEPVIFEQAAEPRTGGYVIDFWGTGYDIAEKMGILPTLQRLGYRIENLWLLNKFGKRVANVDATSLTKLVNNRFLTIRRSDLAETIYQACIAKGIKVRFAEHIVKVDQHANAAVVHLSSAVTEEFDLVIGADGLHSQIRRNVFGATDLYAKDLGAYVVAFTLSDYEPRDALTYLLCPVAHKQVARVSLRDNKTLFLFTFRCDLLTDVAVDAATIKARLASIFADVEWPEVAVALAQLDKTDDFYFDKVSQIRMDSWSKNRVALLGDAAACASLLAGEGSGLAMLEAYVLAGELKQANGNYALAFREYETKLQPFIRNKQKAALSNLYLFASKNKFQVAVAKAMLRASSMPILGKWLLGNMMRDNIHLEEYR